MDESLRVQCPPDALDQFYDKSLRTSDIDGARPRNLYMQTTRVVDPLQPEYPLPKTEVAPPEEPKFVRDSLAVTDIEGTAPKPLYPYAQRDNLQVKDIDGAQASYRPRHQRVRLEAEPHDIMQVQDINPVREKTFRSTDPLVPNYVVNGMRIVDDPVYSKPRALPREHNTPFFSLATGDIEGARAGWKPPHLMNPPLSQRREFRNQNNVSDISGAQADTVKHCIQTKRRTNPLDPQYRSLDGEILTAPTSAAVITPAERREQQQTQADIDAVRELG